MSGKQIGSPYFLQFPLENMFPNPSMFWFSHFLSAIEVIWVLSTNVNMTDHAYICSTWWWKERYIFLSTSGIEISIIVDCFYKLNCQTLFSTLFRVSLIALLFHLDVSSRTLFPRLGSRFSGKHKWNFVDFKEMSPSKILQGRCVKLDASFDGKNRFL